METGNFKIVGTNPFISPIDLEALPHYKLIYSSKSATNKHGYGAVPEVKIFEYIKNE